MIIDDIEHKKLLVFQINLEHGEVFFSESVAIIWNSKILLTQLFIHLTEF